MGSVTDLLNSALKSKKQPRVHNEPYETQVKTSTFFIWVMYTKRGFQIRQGKAGTTALQCEYLNITGKMKPCNLDPKECVMGNKGLISPDGFTFTPTEQPSIEATLRNCPKLNS